MLLKRLPAAFVVAGLTYLSPAHATNGMNIEGYGPIAMGMGGASMAYDNGVAAMMNNPATLGMMSQGHRFDVALGFLGPNVRSTFGVSAESGGDAYFMPAAGWARRQGNLTYGLGLYAQGGMGTEYGSGDWLAMGNNVPSRSELGVGRMIAPIVLNVNDRFSIGGSVDFIWAMLDIKMVADQASVLAMSGVDITDFDPSATAAYLSFSDDNDFTGKAKATGLAGKIGFTYKVSPSFSMGATYHSKTNLSDLKTGATSASFALCDGSGCAPGMPGKITVNDFQWPETYGIGMAWQATPDLLVAADVKHISWSDAMKNFSMTFSSDFLPGPMDMTMPQNWKDQTVYELGFSYKATEALTLRAGGNIASNPIPAATLNPLFPAIVKSHFNLGFGYAFDQTATLNFALSHAPKVTQSIGPMTVSHSQTSWQLMYSKRF